MMVLMMILHIFRVYLTSGFKKSRELTWVMGVVLAVLTASFGVTHYSLPWDQIGYWAVKIVTVLLSLLVPQSEMGHKTCEITFHWAFWLKTTFYMVEP